MLVLTAHYYSFGYDSAFIGTTIARASFKSSFNISKSAAADISSNITSAFQAGAFFGAIFCYLCKSVPDAFSDMGSSLTFFSD